MIYVATNDGYLHAINPANGDELWSYMPSELMARSVDLRENDVSQVKRYALDANIRAFKLDRNGDGIVDGNGTNATDDGCCCSSGRAAAAATTTHSTSPTRPIRSCYGSMAASPATTRSSASARAGRRRS